MTRILSLLAGVGLLWASCLPVVAASLEDIGQLSALRDARLLDEQAEQAVEKIYPLGSVRRISGQLRFAAEITLRGERRKSTWQLSQVHAASDAFTQARELLQRDARLLYWCEGKDCGPSNLWANSVFGYSRLYGPDERQLYAVLAVTGDAELYVLYAVTRGNGRGMLHAERFLADSLPPEMYPAAATLLLQLRNDGRIELASRDGNANLEVAQLARALNRDSTLRVALGGDGASNWRDQLVGAGVRAVRIELNEDSGTAPYIQLLH